MKGHLHISYENPTVEKSMKLVRLLDLYLAIPFIFLDKDNRRRELYGKAGAFREKSYGLEYRVLSNHWLSKLELIQFVFKQVKEANDNFDVKIDSFDAAMIVDTINNNNITSALTLIKKFDIPNCEFVVEEVKPKTIIL